MNNPIQSVVDDFARFVSLIGVATQDTIPDSGDRPHHVADLAAEIVSVRPDLFAAVAMALSLGNIEQATTAARDGLLDYVKHAPNCMHPADATKGLARVVYARFVPGDVASAHAWADRDDVTTCRRQCRAMADKLGLLLADLMPVAAELLARDVEHRAAAEQARREKSAADRCKRETEALTTPFHQQRRRRRLI